ncbi:transcriptional regulator, TetR family [Actinopolyspora xinjiangensis]|uniref:Transcriptional regulator, TetR family n=2 Tax=Actinopolyspora xinjiangensis TaxID=405564 RepID=A0A1H0RX47_9ACTN|nr:transcriptional regulator, TetR family [Actinopolyspora xinjiangensis]
MRLFWEKGYEATSTQELCEATGLGRSSIYNTFTSKHALYVRALEHYLDRTAGEQLAILENPERPTVSRLRDLLTAIIDTEETHRREGRNIGCLGVNSSVEFSGRDPEVAEVLNRDLRRRLEVLRETVASGQRTGEISGTHEAKEVALFLNSTIAGMRVSAQNGADRATLESIATVALEALIP